LSIYSKFIVFYIKSSEKEMKKKMFDLAFIFCCYTL